MSWLCSVGVCVLSNVTRLVAGCFIALLQILWAMSLQSANFWSYAAASDVQLICFDINYELVSFSGLAQFSFVM